MKKLIVLLTAMFLTSFSFSQKLFKENSLNKAIKICKKVSKKDIVQSLDSNSPKELDSIQYALVEEEVRGKIGNLLSEILENYKIFSKKNSERKYKKTFKISLKKGDIKNEIAKEISEYREWMRENGGSNYKEEIDEEYIKSITEDILAKYYIPTLCEGVEKYTNNWLKDEEEAYIDFLRTETVQTKINDEKMIDNMSSEYLTENKKDIEKYLKYLSETHAIKKHYGTGEVDIEVKNKTNLKYIDKVKSLCHGAISSGDSKLKGDNKDEIWENLFIEIQNSIITDIKYQIKISSEFK